MKPSKDNHPPTLRAFSLVELLVALGIIAALALLLVPATQKIREAGQNTKCVSNLRQIGGASILYFAEHNGQLLPSVFWYRPSTMPPTLQGIVQEGIAEYLGLSAPFDGPLTYRDTVLSCPAFKKKFPTLFPSMWNRSYSVNVYAHAYDPYKQQAGTGVEPYFPGNTRRIRKLSAMWLYMDGAGSPPGGFVFTYISPSHFPYIGSPHSKKQNAVFFDGHVERIDGTMIKRPPSDDFWGGPN